MHGFFHLGVSKNNGTPKWMVKIMENPIKMDDLGVPLFLETSTCKCKWLNIPQTSQPTSQPGPPMALACTLATEAVAAARGRRKPHVPGLAESVPMGSLSRGRSNETHIGK